MLAMPKASEENEAQRHPARCDTAATRQTKKGAPTEADASSGFAE
jgi:hypothetical protein